MRKGIVIVMAVMLILGCLTACGSEKNADSTGTSTKAEGGKMQIVTTIFPEYDWVMNVLGENPAGAEVTMLLDNGVDLHSYQPSAADILKISTCDLFIYIGGESDTWVKDALKEATNKNMIVINLMETLGDSVKEEEIVEGMEGHDHDHGEDADHDHEGENEHKEDADYDHEGGSEHKEDADHDHEGGSEHKEDADHDHEDGHKGGDIEYDEHIWLSLRNASAAVKAISDAVRKIDPAHDGVYEKNCTSYLEKLKNLDDEFKKVVDGASVKTLLFGDRFPFRYFVDDYGLDYFAAFVGCSAETEASFETIIFLANKVDELSLHAVMTIEGTDHRIAETIINNTTAKNAQLMSMDSMQSTSMKDVQNGVTYLSIMEKNLSVLKEALK